MAAGQFVTYGDVSPRVGIFAVAKLLARIEPILVLERFALTTPLPKNKGEVIKWRRIRHRSDWCRYLMISSRM